MHSLIIALSLLLSFPAIVHADWFQDQCSAIAVINGAAGSSSNQTIDVSADLDDGMIYSCAAAAGTYDSNGLSGNIYQGEYLASGYSMAFHRFTLSSAIPNGATIDNAYITLKASGNSGWETSSDTLTMWADDVADSAQIDNRTDCAWYTDTDSTAISLTTASVDWTPAAWTTDTSYQSPDIKTIIQELVDDNGGLSSGAHVQIIIARDPLQGLQEALLSYDQSAGTPAQLYIEWTP